MCDSEIRYVVVVMHSQRLNQVKLCSTFDEAVNVAVEIVKQEWIYEKDARALFTEYKQCYSINKSIHIGEV